MSHSSENHLFLLSHVTFILSTIMLLVKSEEVCEANSCSALEKAREIGRSQPSRELKKGGEFEGGDYWEQYESLFAEAWRQLPRLHTELYIYNDSFKEKFINKNLRKAVKKLNKLAQDSKNKIFDESLAKNLVTESDVVKDVFIIGKDDATNYGLFTEKFSKLLLEELEYLSSSGIPMRRPNGMNRYGAILEQIGLKPVLDGVIRDYVRPLAEMIFPEHIAGEDAEENYSFIVDYQRDPNDIMKEKDFDVDLKEHRDSSVATLNVCLGYDNFTGGNVSFRADDPGGFGQDSKGTGDIVMIPGLAVLHKGQHRHAAMPINSGRRVNLIVWLMGKGGYVRVMPYAVDQRLSSKERWGRT